MDGKLLAYLNEPDSPERDELLAHLILEDAAPVVRRIIRYRLHFYLSEAGQNGQNPDAEDLYHDILMRLVRALQQFSAQPIPPAIRDFRHYASRVAINACHDYLRRKYPERTRLKDRLRDLLLRDPDLAIWSSKALGQPEEEGPERENREGGQLCGLQRWRDNLPGPQQSVRWQFLLDAVSLQGDPAEVKARDRLLDQARTMRDRHRETASLAPLLHEILLYLGGPIELDRMVGLVLSLLGIREQQFEPLAEEVELLSLRPPPAGRRRAGRERSQQEALSDQHEVSAEGAPLLQDGLFLDLEALPGEGGTSVPIRAPFANQVAAGWGESISSSRGQAPPLTEALDGKIVLDRLWSALQILPLRQRRTFFFCFATVEGEDLLTLLLEGGVVPPSQMAASLALSLEELLGIWKQMPLRNVELAKIWGVERQQVNKWRYQAVRQLEKLLKPQRS